MTTPTHWPEITIDAIDETRAANTIIEELGRVRALNLADELIDTVRRLDRADAARRRAAGLTDPEPWRF